MNTAFRESFDADLSTIRDVALLRRIKKVVEQVEAARTFQQIPNLKRLEASGKYYRIRVGERWCWRTASIPPPPRSSSQIFNAKAQRRKDAKSPRKTILCFASLRLCAFALNSRSCI